MKYSTYTGAVRWSGGTALLHVGMSADDDHPLVRERPNLWSDTPPGATLSTPRRSGPPAVERATRAPGETRRAPRSPRKPKADADE